MLKRTRRTRKARKVKYGGYVVSGITPSRRKRTPKRTPSRSKPKRTPSRSKPKQR